MKKENLEPEVPEQPETSEKPDTSEKYETSEKPEAEAVTEAESVKPSPIDSLDLKDPETVKALRDALGIDAEIAAAREAGEIAGRNAGIEALTVSPEELGDGLPLHGGGCAPAGPRAVSIFDLAMQAR